MVRRSLLVGERFNMDSTLMPERWRWALSKRLGVFRKGCRYDRMIEWDDGANLLWPHRGDSTRHWDAEAARAFVATIPTDEYDVIYMAGRKVATAFGVPDTIPFGSVLSYVDGDLYRLEWSEVMGTTRLITLPHPSGLNRWWNDADQAVALGAHLRTLQHYRVPHLGWSYLRDDAKYVQRLARRYGGRQHEEGCHDWLVDHMESLLRNYDGRIPFHQYARKLLAWWAFKYTSTQLHHVERAGDGGHGGVESQRCGGSDFRPTLNGTTRRQEVRLTHDASSPSVADQTDSALDAANQVSRILRGASEDDHRLLTLKLQGLTLDEIGEVFGLSKSTIHTRLRGAYERARCAIHQRDDDETA